MNSKLIFSGLALCTAGVATSSTCYAKSGQKQQKNVLFIAVDDLKPLLGCYGDKIAQTPHIDKMAKAGTIFRNAFCQQAVSGATRASLLTGLCPDNTEVWDLKTQIRAKNPDVVTLPQHFKENGYLVAGIGKIFDPRSVDKKSDERSWSGVYIDHEAYYNADFKQPVMSQYQHPDTRKAYNTFRKEALGQGLKKKNEIEKYIQQKIKPTTECADIPYNAYTDGAIADGAVQLIENYTEDQPFFFAVGFKKPHLPFCAPKKYWDLYNREEMPLASFRQKAVDSPDLAYHKAGELQTYSDIPALISFSDIENAILPDSKARELIHGYYACISYTDDMIGKVVAALEQKGLAENTIIVLWGDHGWHLGDHGLWNKHTNFEQATHVPMLILDPSSKKKEVTIPVEFLDIYPTLCDLTGITKPASLDGESLAEVMKGEKNEDSLKPYAVSQYPRGKKMGYSIRDNRYRYTIWVDWTNKKSDVNNITAEELYDYQNDPQETANVVKKTEYQEAYNQMKAYWNDHIKNRIQ
ncbi:MAG: sulfatase [Bacteroidales bacterium]